MREAFFDGFGCAEGGGVLNAASSRRAGALPAFERLLGINTMISILKKRREVRMYTNTVTPSDLNAYYPCSRRIQLLTAFCPTSTAIFGRVLETTILAPRIRPRQSCVLQLQHRFQLLCIIQTLFTLIELGNMH
jgi:hypothetical protein